MHAPRTHVARALQTHVRRAPCRKRAYAIQKPARRRAADGSNGTDHLLEICVEGLAAHRRMPRGPTGHRAGVRCSLAGEGAPVGGCRAGCSGCERRRAPDPLRAKAACNRRVSVCMRATQRGGGGGGVVGGQGGWELPPKWKVGGHTIDDRGGRFRVAAHIAVRSSSEATARASGCNATNSAAASSAVSAWNA